MSFFSSIFGSTAKAPKTAKIANAPRAPEDILRAYETSISLSSTQLIWLSRDASYWTDRCARQLVKLRDEWARNPDAAKWPDVNGLLAQLSAPPEEVIRQLPAAARDAMAMCEREDVPRSKLVDRLSQDPSLVQGLLRQANSASLGGGLTPILSVGAAVDRIGLAGTRAVVLAASVDGLLSKPGGAYDEMLATAWQNMVNSGPIARALAPAFGADGEEAFAIALLHDVGLLIIFDRISALRSANRRPVALPAGWLDELVTELHEPLGAVAANRWGLGIDAADAIGTHHRRESNSEKHPLAEAMFLADSVISAAASGEEPDLVGLWYEGELTGDQARARGILDRMQASV